jgi:carbonic anhydrase/acetyltransferase-like protein (isoleucine patch superfamily)
MRHARLLRVGAAFVADTATVAARVSLGPDANVWYGVAIRGDDATVRLGARTNVQDNTVIHVDPDRPYDIGDDVTIGHAAICHGVFIGDCALIGMGAILLGGCRIGEGAVVGAGALVLEGMEVEPFTVVVGSPARVVRRLDPATRLSEAREHAHAYVLRAREHADGAWDGGVGS